MKTAPVHSSDRKAKDRSPREMGRLLLWLSYAVVGLFLLMCAVIFFCLSTFGIAVTNLALDWMILLSVLLLVLTAVTLRHLTRLSETRNG